jgi:hypothetical protein
MPSGDVEELDRERVGDVGDGVAARGDNPRPGVHDRLRDGDLWDPSPVACQIPAEQRPVSAGGVDGAIVRAVVEAPDQAALALEGLAPFSSGDVPHDGGAVVGGRRE